MADTNDTGRTIAAASFAAGAVGVAVALLNGRRKVHDDRLAIEIDVRSHRKELEQLTAAVESRRKELTTLLASASERGRKSAKNAKAPEIDFDSLQSVDWASLSKRARKGLERAQKGAAKRAPADATMLRQRAAKQGSTAITSARSFGEHLAEEFQRVAPDLKATLDAELGPRTKVATRRASEVGAVAADLGSKARERIDDIAEDLVPEAQKQAARAAETVRDQVEHARPIVEDAAHRASDAVKRGVEDARPRAEELALKARVSAKHAPDAFAEELKRAEAALGDFAGSAQKRSAEALDVAEDKAKASAVAAREGTKEGTAFLFWTGAAASVVYFAFLNDEQRDKVKSVATTVIGEIRDIVNDIQGEDGSFQA